MLRVINSGYIDCLIRSVRREFEPHRMLSLFCKWLELLDKLNRWLFIGHLIMWHHTRLVISLHDTVGHTTIKDTYSTVPVFSVCYYISCQYISVQDTVNRNKWRLTFCTKACKIAHCIHDTFNGQIISKNIGLCHSYTCTWYFGHVCQMCKLNIITKKQN